MSYEIFRRKAEQNSEFEVIPTSEKLYAQGVVFDELDLGIISCRFWYAKEVQDV